MAQEAEEERQFQGQSNQEEDVYVWYEHFLNLCRLSL